MGYDYILEAMQHHGLGHLPQPDNFTTCGRLGIEVNQYNNPIEVYSDDTIEDMREEKVVLDHPEVAGCLKISGDSYDFAPVNMFLNNRPDEEVPDLCLDTFGQSTTTTTTPRPRTTHHH